MTRRISSLSVFRKALERRLNKKIDLGTLATLHVPNAGISQVEDCASLKALTSVDLSGNAIATKEHVTGVLNAPQLASLDLRGNPVTQLENFRRWCIARGHSLRVLDGKEVSALERRYAYNLYPELKPGGEAGSNLSASGSNKKTVEDDLFGPGVVIPRPTSPVAAAAAAVPQEIFSPVTSSPTASSSLQFFRVTPSAKGPAEEETHAKSSSVNGSNSNSNSNSNNNNNSVAPPAPPPQPAPLPIETFRPDIGGAQLMDNVILKQHAHDALLDNDVLGNSFLDQKTREASAATQRRQQQQQQQQPKPHVVKTVVTMEVEKIEVTVVKAARPGADVVLDNDVVGGKSFLEKQLMTDDLSNGNATGSTIPKKPNSQTLPSSANASVNISEMFFEDVLQREEEKKRQAEEKKKQERKGGDMSFFEAKPQYGLPKQETVAVDFFGPKSAKNEQGAGADEESAAAGGKRRNVVETYDVAATSEVGENVSYGVEQVMAYVLYGFVPNAREALKLPTRKDEDLGGLFEFSVVHRRTSPDCFYVRVSRSGVSVHAGHVPQPERWSIDCKISLSDAVMHDLLNGVVDPSNALLNGLLNIEGQLQKLLMFREVFQFALERFTRFRDVWDKCVTEEDVDLEKMARESILEEDVAQALKFLLYAWKGRYPPSWMAVNVPVGYVLICQLRNSLFRKTGGDDAQKAKQRFYNPPKVLLRMASESVEFVRYEEGAKLDGPVLCEIYAKKSELLDLLCGRTALSHVLQQLKSPKSETGGRFVSFAKQDVFSDPSQSPVTPYLCVRNLSDGNCDFEEVLRCFDLNCLSFDRFLAEQKQQKQKEEEEEQRSEREEAAAVAAATAAAAMSTSATPTSASATRPFSPVSAVSPVTTQSSSPLEWVEKLKEVKNEVRKKLNAPPTQQRGRSVFDDDFGSDKREMGVVSKGQKPSQPLEQRGFVPKHIFGDDDE